MPKFSIIMPTRNRAHYLAYALRSAINQRFADFEIVVSNNNSKDNTDQVVRELQDRRIRLVNPGRDLAMHEHWEFALSHATGEYVTYLCDDDASMPGLLSVLDSLSRQSPMDIVVWDGGYFYHGDYQLREWRCLGLMPLMTNETYLAESKLILRELFAFQWPLGMPRILNCCIRTETLRKIRSKVGSLFLPPTPDYSFCALLLAHVPAVVIIDKPLAIFGNARDSVGASAEFRGAAALQFVEQIKRPHRFVPFQFATSGANNIAEALLVAENAAPSEFDGLALDWPEYFAAVRRDLVQMQHNGVDVKQDLAILALLARKDVRSRPKQFAHRRKLVRRFLAWWVARNKVLYRLLTGTKEIRCANILDFVTILDKNSKLPGSIPLSRLVLKHRRDRLARVGAVPLNGGYESN